MFWNHGGGTFLKEGNICWDGKAAEFGIPTLKECGVDASEDMSWVVSQNLEDYDVNVCSNDFLLPTICSLYCRDTPAFALNPLMLNVRSRWVSKSHLGMDNNAVCNINFSMSNPYWLHCCFPSPSLLLTLRSTKTFAIGQSPQLLGLCLPEPMHTRSTAQTLATSSLTKMTTAAIVCCSSWYLQQGYIVQPPLTQRFVLD